MISVVDCAALAFISSTTIQRSKSRDCTPQTPRKLCRVNKAVMNLAEGEACECRRGESALVGVGLLT